MVPYLKIEVMFIGRKNAAIGTDYRIHEEMEIAAPDERFKDYEAMDILKTRIRMELYKKYEHIRDVRIIKMEKI